MGRVGKCMLLLFISFFFFSYNFVLFFEFFFFCISLFGKLNLPSKFYWSKRVPIVSSSCVLFMVILRCFCCFFLVLPYFLSCIISASVCFIKTMLLRLRNSLWKQGQQSNVFPSHSPIAFHLTPSFPHLGRIQRILLMIYLKAINIF